MSSPESKFNKRLQMALKGHYVRIENTLARGTPDVSYTVNAHHHWLELKVYEDGLVKVRPEQLVFAERQKRVMGTYWVLAEREIDKRIDLYRHPFEVEFIDASRRYIIKSQPLFSVDKPVDLNSIIT